MDKRTLPITVLLCLVVVRPLLAGYDMSPLITVLEPTKGKKTSAVVTIKFIGNDKIPVAVEMKVRGREIDLDGQTSYTEDQAANSITVYPTQIVLYPGDIQRVQVQWVGDTIPGKEIAYGLIAEPAPIKLGDENKERKTVEGRVIALTRYEGIIVIRPTGIKPNIIVESAESKPDSTGKPRMILMLSNAGTGLQNLKGMKLQVTPLGKDGKPVSGQIAYTPELASQQTKNSIFAGFKRKLNIAWPLGVPVGIVKVTAEFEEKK
jgi:P pilus assembly chaperone PapD